MTLLLLCLPIVRSGRHQKPYPFPVHDVSVKRALRVSKDRECERVYCDFACKQIEGPARRAVSLSFIRSCELCPNCAVGKHDAKNVYSPAQQRGNPSWGVVHDAQNVNLGGFQPQVSWSLSRC